MQLAGSVFARFGTYCVLLLGVAACASPFDQLVSTYGLDPEVVQGKSFEHLVIRRDFAAESSQLHVYIEGDGTPWIDGNVAAIDPTPSDPLALRLMMLDAGNSVYVGRPCYYGMAGTRNCSSDTWTFGRYSSEVVESVAAAINSIVTTGNHSRVTLIGYSGGGTVALLAAPRIPEVATVVTVAGNLDTEAWTRARGFLPLHNSLNPAESTALSPAIVHVQLAGGLDQVVPLSVTESFRQSGHRSELWMYDDFDHACCWEQAWPEILRRLDTEVGRVTIGDRSHASHR